jgi:hypothetical protein
MNYGGKYQLLHLRIPAQFSNHHVMQTGTQVELFHKKFVDAFIKCCYTNFVIVFRRAIYDRDNFLSIIPYTTMFGILEARFSFWLYTL